MEREFSCKCQGESGPDLGYAGRFGAGVPAIGDSQMLFLETAVSKMKRVGSRVAIIHNGSPLFTGDAGSGPSEIRRYLRCGMGLCQGQTCSKLVKGIVARELGVSPALLEPATSRAPMRPTEMEIAARDGGEQA